MRINNNIQALNAYRNLSSNQMNTSKNLERLSSGMRINRAADDAAGLAISEKMRAQIRGLQMAERNSLDGISLIQTAEGALTEVHSMLHRMRELAVQASNDTNTETDRKEIQKEVDQLTSEINRIGNATEFNTKKLLNGGATRIDPTVEKYGVAIANGEVKTQTVANSIPGVLASGDLTNSITIEAVAGGSYVGTDGNITIKTADGASGASFDAATNTLTISLDYSDVGGGGAATGTIAEINAALANGGLDADFLAGGTDTNVAVNNTTVTLLNGVNEQKGEYSVELTEMFIAGEQLDINGEKYSFVSAGATGNQINIGNTPSDQATNIKAAIALNPNLSARFNVDVIDNKLILKEKTADALDVAPVIERVGNAQGTVHFNEISPGTVGSKAKYELDITNAFRENETIKIDGVTFTGILGTAGTGEFSVDGNARDQANSLKQAIEADGTLNGKYTVNISGSKLTIEAKANGIGTMTKPETDLTVAIPGEFTFGIERSIIGQSFTIDGIEIQVVNDSTQFNDDVNTGKAMRHSDNLQEQAENLRKAIERNPELGKKYFVDGSGTNVVLKQRPGFESAVLPNIMLSNTGDGDVFKSNLQIGPNQHQILTVELHDIRSPKLGISTTDPRTKIVDMNGDLIEGAAFNVVKNISNGVNEGFVEYSIDVSSHEKASAAIKVFDTAIERVNGERASLGALQNRLEHTINNLKVTHENLSSSESRIRDADMALEMTAFTKNNILNQSAQAMLAQANQLPQGVLQLLQG